MVFLNKLFLPYNSIIIALLSATIITAEKNISFNGEGITHIVIVLNFVLFLVGLSRIFFGEYKQKVLINNTLLCLLVNILLLFFLLALKSPDITNAKKYILAYNHLYKPEWFIAIVISVFIPVYLVYIILWPNGYLLKFEINKANYYYLWTVFTYILCVIICDTLLFLFSYLYRVMGLFRNSLKISLFLIVIGIILLGLLSFCYYSIYRPFNTDALNYIDNKYLDHENLSEIPDLFVIMGSLCVTLLINSHSICYKFIELPVFGVVSASGIMFPFTFLIADVVAEHYGYSASRTLIWSTLLAQFVFVIFVYLIYLLPSSNLLIERIYFEQLFSNLIPRQLLAASLCVFFSFFIFSFLISILKTNIQNKKFWKRTLIANVLAKAVLCFFSYVILYYGQYSFSYILTIVWHTWLLKMIIATVGTFAFTIPLIYYLKLNDQRAYPYTKKYNPFALELNFGSRVVQD